MTFFLKVLQLSLGFIKLRWIETKNFDIEKTQKAKDRANRAVNPINQGWRIPGYAIPDV